MCPARATSWPLRHFLDIGRGPRSYRRCGPGLLRVLLAIRLPLRAPRNGVTHLFARMKLVRYELLDNESHPIAKACFGFHAQQTGPLLLELRSINNQPYICDRTLLVYPK